MGIKKGKTMSDSLTASDTALVPHFLYKGYGPIRTFDYGHETDVEVYRDETLVATITVRSTHVIVDTMDFIDYGATMAQGVSHVVYA
jgi:hypothetical protein